MASDTQTKIDIRNCESDEDLEQFVACYNTFIADIWETSVDEIKHWRAVNGENYQTFGAFDGVMIVGICDLNWRTWNPEAPTPVTEIAVLPDRRREGIGQALYQHTSRWTVEREPEVEFFDTMVVDDERSATALEFWGTRGFTATEQHKHVELKLSEVTTPEPFAPAGVVITTFAERPDLMRSAYDMFTLAIKDIPGDDEQVAMSYEKWLQTELEYPGHRAEAKFIAVEGEGNGERVLGWAALELPPQQPGIAWHGMTAVHPEARGRKIATALKLHTIQWARDNDFTAIRTDNEERNGPMRHINIKLGYTPTPSMMKLRGPISRG